MLNQAEQSAVKAILVDLVSGSRVPSVHVENLLGISAEQLTAVAASYPHLEGIELEVLDLAVHNALNLYLNGLSIQDEEWTGKLKTSRSDAERAFEQWNRKI